MKSKSIVAIKHQTGLWSEDGISYWASGEVMGTFSRSPLVESELTATLRVDRSVCELRDILAAPSLVLTLAPDHVRSLLEGCIGYPGSVDGHEWDGGPVSGSSSAGLDVWLASMRQIGAAVTVL